jgi:hypothetical protein
VTIKAKADKAISHYASINKVMCNKTADKEIREVARPLRNCPPDCSFCIPFSRTELKAALRRQSGKAAGPDGITPWMLQKLPEEGLTALLQLCNRSWSHADVPNQWRRADIIPLLKAGKPPADIESYRPVCLTSVITKCSERLYQAQLRFWLETNRKINPDQAGFRANRSTEEQVARVAQIAMDGFNARPRMERTLLTMVDFSRA